MKIIAECGATKSDWRLIDKGAEIKQISALGINTSSMKESAIETTLKGVAEQFLEYSDMVSELHLYIAGIVTETSESLINDIFKTGFPKASIKIESDLIGAARAACGRKPGIAAILGTGSNSCQWDGEYIVKRVYSGGFILGDEGSAAALGKLFLSDFLKGLVPGDIATEFSSLYPSDYNTIVYNVYKSETSPSGYLGSIAPFITEHYDNPYMKNLVDGNIRSFIRRTLKQYDTLKYPVGIVGSFGCALKETILRIAEEEGVKIVSFIPRPIEELIKYHG